MQYRIHIEEPCNENWENMAPNGNGRHCDQCCKTVVDFTDWSLEAIAQYLQEKEKGNVCGHFRSSQINTLFETPETLAEKAWQAAIPLYRKIAAVIILFFAVTISSCGSNQTTGTPKQIQLMGDIALTPAPDTAVSAIDTPHLTGFVGFVDTAQKTNSAKPGQKHKKKKALELINANDMEPEVQGAVELVPEDTNWRQHIPVAKSDSTNK